MAWFNVNIIHLCLFTIAMCTKERVSDQNLEQITNQLFHEIEKRLQAFDSSSNEHQRDDSSECISTNSINTTDTIIKTKESLAAGAVFLDSPDSTSGIKCFKECCNNDDCNLAVFKSKV